MQAVPIHVAHASQQLGARAAVCGLRVVEVALECFDDIVPALEPFGGSAQTPQSLQIAWIQLEHALVGADGGAGGVQSLLAQARELEPQRAIVGVAFQMPDQPRLQLDRCIRLAQPPQDLSSPTSGTAWRMISASRYATILSGACRFSTSPSA